MDDIVVDANVLGHSINPGNEFFEASVDVLLAILEGTEILALDDTGKRQPVVETSLIYHEYLPFLVAGSVPAALLAHLGTNDRLSFVARSRGHLKSDCERLVPRNPRDQVVLGTAAQTSDRHLVSNDYDDFSAPVRKDIKRRIGVTIVDAIEHAVT